MAYIEGDATALPLGNESVDCIVTSPPYNLGIEYDGYDDNLSDHKYDELAWDSIYEMHRVLKPGGRAFINVPGPMNVGAEVRLPFYPWLQNVVSYSPFHLKEVLIWNQGGGDGGCAWGSWMSPNKPRWRGQYEFIIVAYKDRWERGRIGKNDVPREEWPELTRNIWQFPPAKKKQRELFPAPFPPELPRRCILLSTWPGDTVLDPFCGMGTTVQVAEELGRVGIGVDVSLSAVPRTPAVSQVS